MTTLYVFGMQDQDQYACVSKQGSPVNCRALRQRRLCHRHRIPSISGVHGSNTNPFHLEWRFLNQLTNQGQLDICSSLRIDQSRSKDIFRDQLPTLEDIRGRPAVSNHKDTCAQLLLVP